MRCRGQKRSEGRARTALLVSVMVAVLVSLGGCRQEPDAVVDAARTALEDKNIDGFYELVTPRSVSLLQRGVEVAKRSGRVFKLLRSKTPNKAMLPTGTPEAVSIDGKVCTMLYKKGQRRHRVVLRLVRGQWRIDLVEMDLFIQAIGPAQ